MFVYGVEKAKANERLVFFVGGRLRLIHRGERGGVASFYVDSQNLVNQ